MAYLDDLAVKLLQMQSACSRYKDSWVEMYQDCQPYFYPQRPLYENSSEYTAFTTDYKKNVYEEIGRSTASDFVSELTMSVIPHNTNWVKLEPSTQIKYENRNEISYILDQVTDLVFEHINNSNFYSVVAESFLDLIAGTACIFVRKQDSDTEPFTVESVPVVNIDIGQSPSGAVDKIFYKRRLTQEDASILYGFTLDNKEEYNYDYADSKCNYYECVVPNMDGNKYNKDYPYMYYVVSEKDMTVIKEVEYKYNPFIVFRWGTVPEHPYGFGVGFLALPAVQRLSKYYSDYFKAVELRMNPPFLYNVNMFSDIDGFSARSGITIPVDDVDKSIKQLDLGNNISVANNYIERAEENIRKIMLTENIGGINTPFKTATEVSIRDNDTTRKKSANFYRIERELAGRLVKVVLALLNETGKLKVRSRNGEEINLKNSRIIKFSNDIYKFSYKSSISKLDKQKKVRNIVDYMQIMKDIHAFEQADYVIKKPAFMDTITDILDINQNIIPTHSEIMRLEQEKKAKEQLNLDFQEEQLNIQKQSVQNKNAPTQGRR